MKKNFIYNLIYQILILILPIITMPYISRTLGVEQSGIYAYTYSIVYYFIIFSMLGLNNYGNRTIAKVKDDKETLSKEFFNIYCVQVISSVLMLVLYIGYILVIKPGYQLIALIQTIYIISCIFDINWFYFGIEKFKLTVTRNTIIKIISLIFIFVFVKRPEDLWKYTLIMSCSNLVSNLLLFAFLKRFISRPKLSKKEICKHIKPNLILFLPVIAVSIYRMMDKIMLGLQSNVMEVGYYEYAEKAVNIPLTIITALGTVMLPRVSNMVSNQEEDKIKKLIRKTMSFVMFMACPMFWGLIAIANDFTICFFGNEYLKTGCIIQILAITIPFLSWGNVIRTQYLIPKERDKDYVISAYLGAVVNFIFNLNFIPKWGSIGACIGTVIAEFLVMFYQSFVIRKEIEIKTYIKDSMSFFIKALLMFIAIIIIGQYIDNIYIKIVVQVSIGAFIYCILNIKYIFNILNIKDKINNRKKVSK